MAQDETGRPRALAGLVSEAAEELYSRLLVAGALPIGRAFGEVDIECTPARELLDSGIAFRTGEGDTLVRPVTPSSALRTLIERRQRELGEMQRRIFDGWDRLTALLPTTVGTASASGGDGSGVRVLTDVAEISTLAAELWRAAGLHLRGTETGDFPTRPTEHRVFNPRKGVRYQMIYQSSYRSTAAGGKIIDQSVRTGEEAKLRLHVPTKLFHVDNSIALVATERAGRAALLIRAPDLLALIAEWFDALWNDPASVAVGGEAADELTDVQRRILEQLVIGLSDEAIARQQNVSVRTVRRHVNTIYQMLNVTSRFAAGVAAAKRGWL